MGGLLMTMVLGLTGSFGSGKSTVAAMFADLGAAVLDADQAAREVVEPGQPAYSEIVKEFGDGVLGEDRNLDRKKLAETVFNDPETRKKLNHIVHPRVGERMARFLQEHQHDALVILDIPLLLESSGPKIVNKVAVVTTDEKSRFGRLHAKGFNEREIIARLGTQMPQARKVKLADYVIQNEGDLAATRSQVVKIAGECGLHAKN